MKKIDYKKLIEMSIAAQSQMLGKEAAIGLLREIEDLEVDPEGNVQEIGKNPEATLVEVVEKYEQALGPVGPAVIARSIEKQLGEEKKQELPEIVKERL